MVDNKPEGAGVGSTLFDRIVSDGECPEELGLKDVVLLMVATFDSPATGRGVDLLNAEIQLRGFIARCLLPATKAGKGFASRIHPVTLGLTKDHPWRFPPWSDSSTGLETLYTIRRTDIAKLADRIQGGDGFKEWIGANPAVTRSSAVAYKSGADGAATPPYLTTRQIVDHFGPYMGVANPAKVLSRYPKWVTKGAALIMRGKPGKVGAAQWDPVKVALNLLEKQPPPEPEDLGPLQQLHLDRVFSMKLLHPWGPIWVKSKPL